MVYMDVYFNRAVKFSQLSLFYSFYHGNQCIKINVYYLNVNTVYTRNACSQFLIYHWHALNTVISVGNNT